MFTGTSSDNRRVTTHNSRALIKGQSVYMGYSPLHRPVGRVVQAFLPFPPKNGACDFHRTPLQLYNVETPSLYFRIKIYVKRGCAFVGWLYLDLGKVCQTYFVSSEAKLSRPSNQP